MVVEATKAEALEEALVEEEAKAEVMVVHAEAKAEAATAEVLTAEVVKAAMAEAATAEVLIAEVLILEAAITEVLIAAEAKKEDQEEPARATEKAEVLVAEKVVLAVTHHLVKENLEEEVSK